MDNATLICTYCKGRNDPPLRCSRCRSVYYCSKECQKLDWEPRHRRLCKVWQKVATAKAAKAWHELQELLQAISVSDAEEGFHKAKREIEQLTNEGVHPVSENRESHDNLNPSRLLPTNEKITPIAPDSDVSVFESISTPTQPCPAEPVVQKMAGSLERMQVEYVVEEMLHCYQIRFKMDCQDSDNFHQNPHQFAFTIQKIPSNKCNRIVLTIQCKSDRMKNLLCMQLDRLSDLQPVEPNITTDEEGYMNVRIPTTLSDSVDFTIPSGHPLTSVSAINTLTCRFCGYHLIPANTIKKSLPLPSGNWDEVADYLSCYDGPAAISFSPESAAAKPGVALEDYGQFILHQDDVGDSVCSLAIEEYGQDGNDYGNENNYQKNMDTVLYRGSRIWQSAVTGCTLCCSQCCEPLGMVSGKSPEAFRLWKHRLATAIGDTDYDQHTVGKFLANEMVRYAETKAIFTFMVHMPHLLHQATTTSTRQCLLLRLLSWDTRLAIHEDSSTTNDDDGVDVLHFRRVAKIIYEETIEPILSSQSDVTKWTWGGVDLCCPTDTFLPPNLRDNNNTSDFPEQACVKICLPNDEWYELRELLISGSKLFSKQVAHATITLKIGKIKLQDNNKAVGLSALFLS